MILVAMDLDVSCKLEGSEYTAQEMFKLSKNSKGPNNNVVFRHLKLNDKKNLNLKFNEYELNLPISHIVEMANGKKIFISAMESKKFLNIKCLEIRKDISVLNNLMECEWVSDIYSINISIHKIADLLLYMIKEEIWISSISIDNGIISIYTNIELPETIDDVVVYKLYQLQIVIDKVNNILSCNYDPKPIDIEIPEINESTIWNFDFPVIEYANTFESHNAFITMMFFKNHQNIVLGKIVRVIDQKIYELISLENFHNSAPVNNNSMETNTPVNNDINTVESKTPKVE